MAYSQETWQEARLVPKKWYQFFKKNKYEIVLSFKFIRATSPQLKILLEC